MSFRYALYDRTFEIFNKTSRIHVALLMANDHVGQIVLV